MQCRSVGISKLKMENGIGGGNLSQQLSGLSIEDNSVNGYSNNINGMNKSDGLFQVMKAVEAAEATIKQQVFFDFIS